MFALRLLESLSCGSGGSKTCLLLSSCGIKYFPPPPNYDHIVLPERQKLKFFDKVPQFPPNMKPPKMQKRLRYMRGPEELHNTLQLKQFGIVARGGGRLRFEHFEMMRMGLVRKLDMKTMFAIWRVDPPWQPITKKGQGQRMGGGKGNIDHYVTPVKSGRVLLEIGGKCEFKHVSEMLRVVAERLPFKAEVVSQRIMEENAARERRIEHKNINQYTMEYIIKNNMGGCHKMMSKYDMKWFGKYI